jgi:hypothetical protein
MTLYKNQKVGDSTDLMEQGEILKLFLTVDN